MALKLDTAAHAFHLISQEVKEAFKSLTIHYIVHHEGQVTEALAATAQDIMTHPAAETARGLLSRSRTSGESGILGIVAAREDMFFGLSSRSSVLALCTMNVDSYSSLKDAQQHAWHLAWHAIDALLWHGNAAMREEGGRELIVRRRNALGVTMANLKADVFSAVMSALHDDRNAVRSIAVTRGESPLIPKSCHDPEYYPFVMVIDGANAVLEKIGGQTLPPRRFMDTALKAGEDIARAYGDESLKNWMSFGGPAQDMAWRGYSREDILSAAINTSDNVDVQATGHLVSELTKIDPAPPEAISRHYNPFSDDSFNRALHVKIVSEVFEDAIAQSLKNRITGYFAQVANAQNTLLTEGRTLGWCAAALQIAGKAFDFALSGGRDPESAARHEFAKEQENTDWGDLKVLGDEVVKRYREGELVTMSTLLELCEGEKPMTAVARSVDMTINDPVYKASLDAGHNGPLPGLIAGLRGPAVTTGPSGPALSVNLTMGPSGAGEQGGVTVPVNEEQEDSKAG